MTPTSPRYRGSSPIALAPLVLTLALGGIAGAACTTSICTGGNPCTISGTNTIDDGCTLDWGSTQDVVISGTVQTGADNRSFTLKAHSFDVTGTVRAKGASALLSIQTSGTGDPLFKTRVGGTIDVGNGGAASIAAAGSVDVSGTDFTADGNSALQGGSIDISGTTVSVTKTIHADAPSGGDAGSITITATTGSVSLSGTGSITANGAGTLSFGGGITVSAATTLTQGKTMQAKGNGGGDGGSIILTSGSSGTSGLITVSGTLNTSGSGTDSYGGSIDVLGGAVTSSAVWTNKGDSLGGIVDVDAIGGDININAAIGVDGTNGGSGGEVFVAGDAAVTIDGSITADATGTGSAAGSISIAAGTNHTLSVKKLLEATAANAGAADGTILIGPACNVSLTDTVRTRNTSVGFGLNDISYRGTMTLTSGDSLLADNPAATHCDDAVGNIIRCRCPDANANGVCDSMTCVSSPTLSGTVTPTALVCPTVMPACG
jgi:hypothetical protein